MRRKNSAISLRTNKSKLKLKEPVTKPIAQAKKSAGWKRSWLKVRVEKFLERALWLS
jgi:hypothetical protein